LHKYPSKSWPGRDAARSPPGFLVSRRFTTAHALKRNQRKKKWAHAHLPPTCCLPYEQVKAIQPTLTSLAKITPGPATLSFSPNTRCTMALATLGFYAFRGRIAMQRRLHRQISTNEARRAQCTDISLP
jgi:hypothetical protein